MAKKIIKRKCFLLEGDGQFGGSYITMCAVAKGVGDGDSAETVVSVSSLTNMLIGYGAVENVDCVSFTVLGDIERTELGHAMLKVGRELVSLDGQCSTIEEVEE